MIDPKDQQKANQIKIAVCEYLLSLNDGLEHAFIPPTSVDWLGNGITKAVLSVLEGLEGEAAP